MRYGQKQDKFDYEDDFEELDTTKEIRGLNADSPYRKLFGANTDILMKGGSFMMYPQSWLDIFTPSENQMMAFLCYWATLTKAWERKGRFYCSQSVIVEALRLGRSRQTKCLQSLQRMGVISIETQHSKRIFKINHDAIVSKLLSGNKRKEMPPKPKIFRSSIKLPKKRDDGVSGQKYASKRTKVRY